MAASQNPEDDHALFYDRGHLAENLRKIFFVLNKDSNKENLYSICAEFSSSRCLNFDPADMTINFDSNKKAIWAIKKINKSDENDQFIATISYKDYNLCLSPNNNNNWTDPGMSTIGLLMKQDEVIEDDREKCLFEFTEYIH